MATPSTTDLCIWQVSDGSYRVRLMSSDDWTVALKVLRFDSYWHEVCQGLRPVFRFPVVGTARIDGVATVRTLRDVLGIEVRKPGPVVWSDGQQVRTAGTAVEMARLIGIDREDVRRMARYGCSFSNGYAGYNDPDGV